MTFDSRREQQLQMRIADLETQLERRPITEPILTPGIEYFYGLTTTNIILADGKFGSVQVQQLIPSGKWVDVNNWILDNVYPVARKDGFQISSGKFVKVSRDPISGLWVCELVYDCYDSVTSS